MNVKTNWPVSRLAVGATLALGLAIGFVAAQDSALSIDDYGVGTDVVDRVLQDKGDRFEEGSKVAFFTRVIGGADGDRIRHVWLFENKEVVSIGLTLGGSHWRTFSRKTLPPGSAGAWVVEARDSEDRVLARAEFTCVAAGSGTAETPSSP